MFGKSDRERVDDTLLMIRNSALLDPSTRARIVTLVGARFPRLTQAERQTYGQLSAAMSVAAHIGPGVQRGNQAEREKRRAIFLLWKTMGATLPAPTDVNGRANAAMTMGVGQLDAAFADAMMKAAVVACSAGGSLAYNQLVANPEQFLLRHRVMVRGSTAGRVRFSTGPTGDYQNVMAFNFQYNAGSDVFEFLEAPLGLLGSAHPVQVISVPAVHWSDVPGVGVAPGNFAGVLGCELAGGPTLMVTTQFTGCSFCWTTHGGVLRASHVSPSGDVAKPNYPGGGQALALRLVNQPGLMSNAGNTALTVFGNHAGNAVTPGGGNAFYPPKVQGAGAGQMKWVSIFGFGGGGWRFYTQAVDGAGTIMAGEARRIM